VDNLFLDVVSRQQVKVDGFAASHLPSMRTYINVSPAVGAAVLTVALSVVSTASLSSARPSAGESVRHVLDVALGRSAHLRHLAAW
jgi:hypothetical protein